MNKRERRRFFHNMLQQQHNETACYIQTLYVRSKDGAKSMQSTKGNNSSRPQPALPVRTMAPDKALGARRADGCPPWRRLQIAHLTKPFIDPMNKSKIQSSPQHGSIIIIFLFLYV